MTNPARLNRPLRDVPAAQVKGFASLVELALDLRWSWNHGADGVWRQLDPALWELTHNAWALLQTVSRARIESLLRDPGFCQRIEDLLRARQEAAQAPAWLQHAHPNSVLTGIAYFSMEFMLSEALPIYAGGLGNVAGDQLKAASDLGVPVIGVGLLWAQGYFRQVIGRDGAQQAVFPYNNPGDLPITPLRQANGEWLRLRLNVLGHPLWLRAWQVQVGRASLYLLDSNDAANYPPDRGITSELYGGAPQLRLLQEVVLGIGGWRLLATLGIEPEVCHLNEGHAAFAALERARSFMHGTGQPFEVAAAVTRAGNLFTTHTAVAAGFDRFAPALIEHTLGDYARQELGITVHDLLALGRSNPFDPAQDFNMAYLAIRTSGAVNGVSRLHGAVSRHLFQPLFMGWPAQDVPVGHITNGVHMPSWDSAQADALWTQAAGKTRWLGTLETLEQDVLHIPDADLWRCRNAARQSLVDYARERLSCQLAASGALPEELRGARQLFDPNTLTLGFARRFASYKRPDLLLHDPQRLLRLLADPARPIQLIIAGKAHPADPEGQALIQQWISFIRHTPARQHVIFLSDYDLLLTEHLVQGVDVWLNTPRRPWEACGTSGMKVLVNGGINLSELDGWWAEAYTPQVGWAVGDCQEYGDNSSHDAVDAEALYGLLEREVIPEFYSRDQHGIPKAWLQRMRNSMARLTPRFSTNRAVREYTEQHYLPAAVAYRQRAADKGAKGVQIVRWRQTLNAKWAALSFGKVSVVTADAQHTFEVQVHLNDLDPDSVRVELYAEASDGHSMRLEMRRVRSLPNVAGGYVYGAKVSAVRPATDFTPRIIANRPDVAVPLEAAFILWQR
jgi:glycogen phosphorylase